MHDGRHGGHRHGRHAAESPPCRNAASPERAARVPAAQAREYLLEAALELFQRDGVRAVSVEAVARRAGVNKMSVYRCFASKEALIAAYMARLEEDFRRFWEKNLARHGGDAIRQLLDIFEALAAQDAPDARWGQAFLSLCTEFPDGEHPVRGHVERFTATLREKFAERCRAAGLAEPERLAAALVLLVQGICAACRTCGPCSAPVQTAPDVARALLSGALSTRAAR